MRSDSGLPHRPNQVKFAAPGGISGDGEESMVNYPQKIVNQCGSEEIGRAHV